MCFVFFFLQYYILTCFCVVSCMQRSLWRKMKAEFVLLGLVFTVEIFPNLKHRASPELKEQLMHSFKPGDCKYFCC